MKKLSLIIIALLLFIGLNAQKESCKVLLEKISGEYKGKCHEGLANGKGTSKGEDTYSGQFKDGLPDGKGTYVFKNGDVYKGNWKNGLKNGQGKFNYTLGGKSYTLTGYWKDDEYVGKTNPDVSYRVTASSGIIHYKVEKLDGEGDEITFSILSAMTKFVPVDLQIDITSGKLVQSGKEFLINQYFLPLNCDISYSIAVGAQRKQCHFIVDIIEKGRYKIVLSND
jgi:hypothetical protein